VIFALVLAIVGAVGLGAYAVIKSAVDSNDNDPSRTVPSLPGVPSVPGIPTPPGTPSGPSKPSRPSRPTTPSSNFSTAGLSRSMSTARRLAGRGARVELARITADQLQVIARTGSSRKVVLVSAGFTRSIGTPGGELTGNEFPFSTLRPGVAGRLVRALAGRGVSARRIDYMVVLRNPVTKEVQWLVYPRGGSAHFQADARGGSLTRVG
jgi:hypothetical protein